MKLKNPDYKVKIDKQILTDFFLTDGEVTKAHLKEIKKVFNAVMIKHFSKYCMWSDDMFQYAILAILERRNQYDPSFSAYNYIYTCFRNEIGNKINKLTRENLVEDILAFKEQISMDGMAELPSEIAKYTTYLIGTEDFTFKRIPKGDVLNIILYLRLNESRRQVAIPDFVLHHKNAIQTLYKMLKDFTDL